MTTFGEFVSTHQITMVASYTAFNPNMIEGGENMDHWRCAFKMGRRSMTVYFSMGAGLDGREPVADEVLACLVSDARSVDYCRGFEDWCGDFGYSSDSRKAEQTFKACERSGKRLKRFLAGEYDALLQCEEA